MKRGTESVSEIKATNITKHEGHVSRQERESLLGQRGCLIWFTGLSGSGKSTIAYTVEHELVKRGRLCYVLDGDNIRHGLNKNLGFSAEDRAENIRRIGEVGKLFVDTGVITLTAFISPYRADRDANRALLAAGEFIEIFMDVPIETCERRDPKGLYKKARAGEIKGFTGIDDPYEAPVKPELVIKNGECTVQEAATQVIAYLDKKGIIRL
jgi:adenylylsulfate kinase